MRTLRRLFLCLVTCLTLGAPAPLLAQGGRAEINGTITRVSADTTTDQRTGQNYYTTRIAMTKSELARLGDVKLIPGMPVEAFVQTGERTVMSYLIKPLQDQFMRAFREK